MGPVECTGYFDINQYVQSSFLSADSTLRTLSLHEVSSYIADSITAERTAAFVCFQLLRTTL
jgi:hypothetical protein